MRKTFLLGTALVAVVGVLDACSSSSGDSTASTDGGSSEAASGSDGSSGGLESPDGSVVPADATAPPAFWDPGGIPAAKNVMMFKFENRSNGVLADSEIYWRFELAGKVELHSIAEQALYDMPANASGRMYFYVCRKTDTDCATDPTKSKYYDFIEHTIGAARYNGNTTRVDAFGLKIAMRLHSQNGDEQTVGEDYATFAESRDATFQRFVSEVAPEFQAAAQPPNAPYRIVQPGAAGFDDGGAHATYYNGFVDQLWAANGITLPKPGPNGAGLGSNPDLSAAIYRHVGATAGTFDANGKLLVKTLWDDATTFYQAAPADYYAMFWHRHGLGGHAYGFPYDDVGGYSTYISHANPEYMLVAIGW